MGGPLLRHMKCMENYDQRSNRLVGGDPSGPQYEHAKQVSRTFS